jgi:histidine triad (HIT) family protein
MIAKLLFRLARTCLVGAAVRFGFAHLSGLLPVRRVCETRRIIAFHHPRPAWKRHVLFVPKEPIPSLRGVRPEQVPLVRRLVELALAVASRERFDRDGFALLANGGAYQDVAQLHFHLASHPREAWYRCPDRPAGTALLETDALTAHRHPRPRRAVHIVMLPTRAPSAQTDPGFDDAFIDAAILAAQDLVTRLNLEPSGYPLAISAPPGRTTARPCFHLVAGAELA